MSNQIKKGVNAHDQTKINITPRDRLMRAWEDTMEHARDYKRFAEVYEGTPVGSLFQNLAESQGHCAAALHDMLLQEGNRE